MQRTFISRRQNHRAQREMTGLDDVRIIVRSCPASTHITHLRATILRIDLRLEAQDIPIRATIAQSCDVFIDLINARYVTHVYLPLLVAQPVSGSPAIAARASGLGGPAMPP